MELSVRTQAVATTADGQVIGEEPGVRALSTQLRKLRRTSKAYARTKRGSKGRDKAAAKLANIHARVVWLRRSSLHQLTTELASSHATVVVEHLDVAAMLRSVRGAWGVVDQRSGAALRGYAVGRSCPLRGVPGCLEPGRVVTHLHAQRHWPDVRGVSPTA